MSNLVCQGCGDALPANRRPGRQRKWCSDKCRKVTLYSGQCVDCGAATNGSDGPGRAGKRCGPCAVRHRHSRRIWTQDTVIEAIRAWESAYGFAPSASDWNIAAARRRVDADIRVRRYYDDTVGTWPPTSAVQKVFGSWADAIEAAGFSRPETSRYGRPGEDLASPLVREAVSRYENGEGCIVIARDLDVSSTCVVEWLHRSGVEMRTAVEGAALYRTRLGEKAAA